MGQGRESSNPAPKAREPRAPHLHQRMLGLLCDSGDMDDTYPDRQLHKLGPSKKWFNEKWVATLVSMRNFPLTEAMLANAIVPLEELSEGPLKKK